MTESVFRPDPSTAPFWEGTRRHELRLQRCIKCRRWQQLSQAACASCLSALRWERVSGTGSVYSYSVVRRPATPDLPVPYVVAIVELTEGPRLLTTLLGIAPDAVRIGMRVAVEFQHLPDMTIYPFRPVEVA